MKKLITILFLISVIAIMGCQKQTINYVEPHITDIPCGAETSCPEGLTCLGLSDSTVCVDPNICDWYCSEDEECGILESYPPQVSCS
ncbi:MAG: hypothetical protein ABIF40_01610 [archaeon]